MSNIEDHISSIVEEVFESYKAYNPLEGALIPFLQDVQAKIGYLPELALKRAASLLKMSESHILGVATFYHQFRLKPKAKHIITVCRGTACHVGGSMEIYNFLMDYLNLTPPEDTSSDGLFLVQQVRCIGACALAPIIKVDDVVYGRINSTRVMGIVSKYRRLEEKKT